MNGQDDVAATPQASGSGATFDRHAALAEAERRAGTEHENGQYLIYRFRR